MAGGWIKFEVDTPEKPEVLALTAAMGWDDPDLTVGKLLRVWRWFDQQTLEGNAKRVTSALLDRIVGIPGFASEMEKVGWLIVSDDGISLPNFDRHNGETAKKRAETAKRVASHRSKKTSESSDQNESSRTIIPRPIRTQVFERDRCTCVYCGRKEGEYAPPEIASDAFMCLDHVIPESRGGLSDPSNLVCACAVCNRFKSDRTPDECGLRWPTDGSGKRFGNAKSVTSALPKEEKNREDKKEQKQKTTRVAALEPAALVLDGVEEQTAIEFLALRRAKGAKLTAGAWDGIKREAEKAQWSLQDAVAKCLARGWRGFEADWVASQPARASPQAKFDPVAYVNRNRPTANHDQPDNIIDV